MEKFYMVYVEGTRLPEFKHEDYQTAQKEAKRLAELHHGKKVYLLETVGFFMAPPTLTWTDLRKGEEIPF